MSARNLDSLRSEPSLPIADRDMDRRVAILIAKVAALEARPIVTGYSEQVVNRLSARIAKVEDYLRNRRKSVEIKFSRGDWENGPFNRAWLVEQLVKERNRSHGLRKDINKLEARISTLEAK